MRRILIGLVLGLMVASSCVSKGKFVALQEEYTAAKEKHSEINSAYSEALLELEALSKRLDEVRDELLKQNAVTGQLLAEKITLQTRIRELDQHIGSLTSEAQSRQEELNQELRSRNETLALKESQLNKIIEWYQSTTKLTQELSSKLYEKIKLKESDEVGLEQSPDGAKVIFYANYAFSGTDISSNATPFIMTLGEILKDYPTLKVNIEGHTDNERVTPTRNYQDNWDLSALRASSMARFLQETVGINSNQLTVQAKAGYAPRVSNQTTAGQELNNRVEWIINRDVSELVRLVDEIK